jgi:hypothetical protein
MGIRLASLVAIGVLSLGLSGTAHAMVGLSLVGAGMESKPSYSSSGTDLSTSSKLAVGFGALLDFKEGKRTDFEIGVISVPSKFGFTKNSSDYVYKINTLVVPATLWFRLVPFVSVGIGGFYQHLSGNGDIDTTTNGSTSSSTGSTGLSTGNYGGQAGARIRIPLGMTTSLVADAQYLYGLKNLGGSGDDFKSRDLLFLAGFRFGI